jgi:hypothetical protein
MSKQKTNPTNKTENPSFEEEERQVARVSLNTLVNEMGISKASVLKHRKKLKKVGLIDWTVVNGVCEYVFLLETGTEAQKEFAISQLTRRA